MILVLRLSSGENELTEIATLPCEQIHGRCNAVIIFTIAAAPAAELPSPAPEICLPRFCSV